MKKHLLLLPLFLLSQYLYSQEPAAQSPITDTLLTPEEAVRIALENNYDIRLTQGDAEIAKLNNIKANAGMLPRIDFVAGDNIGLNAFQQQNLADGRNIEAYGAFTNTANIGVQLNWTLFDGRRMFIAKQRLEELETLGQLNLQNQVQQTTAAVLLAYYEIVRTRLNERALAEVITLNEERLRIAEARLAAGFAAQPDALQARIDLNQRRTDLLNQQTQTAAAKRELNRLLVRPPQTPFSVDEDLVNTYAPNRNTLLEKMSVQNPQLLSLQKNAVVAALIVDEAHTLNKIRIDGVSQFNIQRTDNAAGFLLNNTFGGLSVGATLSIPLYTGGNLRRQVEVAQVQARQSNILVESQRLFIEAELDNQLAFFNANQQVLSLEEESVESARESLNISTQRFRLGQTNALEVQTAQNTLEQALARRNIVQYNLKATEIQLRLLAGEL
jgi:outer membrane protein